MSTDPDALADELSGIITALESTPDNVGLLRREIAIMRELEMTPEALDTTLRLSALVMVEEHLWSQFFEELLQEPLNLDSFVQIIEHFDSAEKDYFSINLLEQHARFLLETSKIGDQNHDDAVASFLDAENMRGMLASIYVQCAGDLCSSHRLWSLWRDWEMEQLLTADDRPMQLERLHSMYLERLATPHLDIESTAAAYSTFCTENEPTEYEARMVTATSTSLKAKAKLSGERRHGKTREDFEQQLLSATDALSRIPTLVAYMEWEMDPKAKSTGSHGPVLDQALIRSISERTVAAYSMVGAQTAEDDTRAQLKDGEAAIWQRYVNWLRLSDNEAAAEVAMRATRACPQSASAWCTLLHEMERQQCLETDMSAAFDRAQDLGAMFTAGSTSFIDVFVTRAAQQYRLLAASNNEDHTSIIETADRGFALLERLNKAGDPSLRLEKFLLEWAESRAPSQLDKVLELIDKPLRSRSASYQLILLKAGLECRRGNRTAARQIYAAAIQRSDLDWPEAVFEAYVQFEDIHGTVDSILQTRSKVAKETQRLARRREKQHEQMAAEYVMPESTIEQAPAPAPEVQIQEENSETKESSHNETKRDREHTTVLVGGLTKGTPQALVESFFESCGRIRETTILSDESRPSDSALLEFQAVDAVASALGKDRRKLDGQEVSVTMLWRSTLFITNFPRDIDDVAIRTLFGNYGHILQSRWPSRKYADNRRFCYITMDTPGAAESALALDGFRPDPSSRFGLTVRISDPSAKAKRTDEKDTVLFVGGLGSKTTEQDVKDLFEDQKGSIRNLKLGWDSVKGICKGFAFVTLSSEADAKEGLKLHGTSYHGKKLKVEQSDPNFNNKKAVSDAEMKDKRSRTVRLNDVPAGMQEALLQQALEKVVPVRRLELFEKTNHAQAELENQADVGKLLLRIEPFVVDGATITFAESGRRQPAAPIEQKESKASEVKGDPLAFAPRVARRSGNTLGRGNHGKTKAAPTPLAVPASGNAQDAFRAVVDAKNKQREGNLESTRAKRPLDQAVNVEGSSDQETKKPKTG